MSATPDAPASAIAGYTDAGRRRGFYSGAREIDAAPVVVEGRLPDWLHGRLLLNGPALWELPHGQFEHWFDGLAMLHRLQIGPGGVQYRSRFVRSQSYLQAMARGAPATAEFDTPSPASLWTRLAGAPVTDNPAVVMSRVGAQWIAVTEAPTLMGFDPGTLATTGPLPLSDDAHIHLMAAHGFTDDAGNYWNVGTKLGPTCEVKLFRLRPASNRREVLARLRMPKAGYTHAFAMTARHAIVWETAMRAQPLSFRFSAKAYIRNFRWEPASGSRLHAIALADGAVRSWDAPPMMCFHAVQAWEDGEALVAELATYDDARVFDELRLAPLRQGRPLRAVPQLTRYRLEPGRSQARVEPFGAAFELPQVHPARWGHARAGIAWGAGLDAGADSRFFDRTLRLDLQTGETRCWQRERATQLEPLFVPRPGAQAEDDGVLLVPTLADGDEGTRIGVVDAASMQCLALLHVPQVIPFGFHAAWVP